MGKFDPFLTPKFPLSSLLTSFIAWLLGDIFQFLPSCDLGVSFTFHFCKKNYGIIHNVWCIKFYSIHSTGVLLCLLWNLMHQTIIFLWNGVLIRNWTENKEADAICFEIRFLRKKNKELKRKVPSKIYGSYFIMEKNKNIFWFVNNSEYHHWEMGLMWFKNWGFQKMTITKNILLNRHSSKIRKIRMIFGIENWLWKSYLGPFWWPMWTSVKVKSKKYFSITDVFAKIYSLLTHVRKTPPLRSH